MECVGRPRHSLHSADTTHKSVSATSVALSGFSNPVQLLDKIKMSLFCASTRSCPVAACCGAPSFLEGLPRIRVVSRRTDPPRRRRTILISCQSGDMRKSPGFHFLSRPTSLPDNSARLAIERGFLNQELREIGCFLDGECCCELKARELRVDNDAKARPGGGVLPKIDEVIQGSSSPEEK